MMIKTTMQELEKAVEVAEHSGKDEVKIDLVVAKDILDIFKEKQRFLETNKTGAKLVDYDDMLYPQFAFKYEKVISRETWEKLKEEAKRLLNDPDKLSASERVRSHWQSIASGNIPFGYKIETRP